MDIEKKRFQTLFPNLCLEMEQEPQKVEISAVKSDISKGEKASSKTFAGYQPDAIDFLRRCDNKQEAEEIINYLEKRHEIGGGYAAKIRKQLREKGVRSFGSKKTADYYSREGMI